MEKLPPFDRPGIQKYQHQRFWQIIFPTVLFSFLLGVVGGFIILAEAQTDRLLADISIIWLVIPLLFSALILLAVLVGLIYLVTRLLTIIPVYSRKLQNFFYRIEQGTRKATASIIKPISWINHLGSRIKLFINKIGL
jgi:hypothetical protein